LLPRPMPAGCTAMAATIMDPSRWVTPTITERHP
jgi:hypothetical protein